MNALEIWLAVAFFWIALSYSMAGFGGGSSYLAVLVFAGLPYQSVPPLALVCNLIVTGCAVWSFNRMGHFRLMNVLPFVIFSIPAAYLGGRISIGKELFSLLLGFSLLAVSVRLMIFGKDRDCEAPVSRKRIWAAGLPAGAALGFLSGLVGIGGGIFLSPLLLLARWAGAKEAASSAAFFIFVNSWAGLSGHLHKGGGGFALLIPLGLAVFAGGQLGSRLGACRIPGLSLARITAALVLAASVKLILEVAA